MLGVDTNGRSIITVPWNKTGILILPVVFYLKKMSLVAGPSFAGITVQVPVFTIKLKAAALVYSCWAQQPQLHQKKPHRRSDTRAASFQENSPSQMPISC